MTLLEFIGHNHDKQSGVTIAPDISEQDSLMEPRVPIEIEYIQSPDKYETRPGRERVQQMVEMMDTMLAEHPDWLPPKLDEATKTLVVRNPATKLLYGESQTLREWYVDAAQAHAAALYPLQRPDIERLPSGELVDDVSRAYYYHGLDPRGIRSRAEVMKGAVVARMGDAVKIQWTSLACGGAVPVAEALGSLHNAASIHVDLVDINKSSLAFATDLIRQECGLEPVESPHEDVARSFTTHEKNLIRGLISSDSLVNELGEGESNVVDALGIFEYFPYEESVVFLRNAYRLVEEGGILVIGNMLSDRPMMDFMQRGVGWPHLYPRSLDELSSIVIEAGIDPAKARMLLPTDGLYAVVEIGK